MNAMVIKEMMVPLADYATVHEDANLYEAVMALEEAQKKFDQHRARHRAVLVVDGRGRVVGKLDQINVLAGLEPKYADLEEGEKIRANFTPEFLKSILDRYGLWAHPLEAICRKAVDIKVRDIMYSPSQGELLAEEETLNQAIHQLVMGRHQSLLVTRVDEVVGILRLSDVFERVCEQIKACRI